MGIFKRSEVWVLLTFVTAGVAFVLFTQTRKDQDSALEVTSVVEDGKAKITQAPFRIEGVKLTQEGDASWLLELAVRYKNRTESALLLDAPQAKLVTASGAEVPRFFLAFASPPTVPPDAEEMVELRYWLKPQHRDTQLWLQILDERAKVDLTEPEPAKSAPVAEADPAS